MTNPMAVYDAIKKISPKAKAEADSFMQGLTSRYKEDNPAPNDVIQQGLESILAKHRPSSSVFSLTQNQHAIGLATVLAGIAFLAGFPYVPPPLY